MLKVRVDERDPPIPGNEILTAAPDNRDERREGIHFGHQRDWLGVDRCSVFAQTYADDGWSEERSGCGRSNAPHEEIFVTVPDGARLSSHSEHRGRRPHRGAVRA